MNQWIDFRQLREQLRFEDVLRFYQVEVQRKGSQHTGFCPLPNHGERGRSASFSANLERGMFRCFRCQAQGNVLDFAALMERVDPRDGSALRKVAEKLAKQFELLRPTPPRTKPSQPGPEPGLPLPGSIVVNQPLDFELKGLDTKHPCFARLGLKPETVAHFGLGVASRGSLKGQLAIPLHDQAGKLIGYAGKAVEESTADSQGPGCRFPERRERNGVVHEFDPEAFLYQGFRHPAPKDELILTRAIESVWWLHQQGFRNVVATMNAHLSETQGSILTTLLKPSGKLWVLANEDGEDRQFAEDVITKAAPLRFVRSVRLPKTRRLTQLSVEELRRLFAA
jgi:hypothetical protein